MRLFERLALKEGMKPIYLNIKKTEAKTKRESYSEYVLADLSVSDKLVSWYLDNLPELSPDLRRKLQPYADKKLYQVRDQDSFVYEQLRKELDVEEDATWRCEKTEKNEIIYTTFLPIQESNPFASIQVMTQKNDLMSVKASTRVENKKLQNLCTEHGFILETPQCMASGEHSLEQCYKIMEFFNLINEIEKTSSTELLRIFYHLNIPLDSFRLIIEPKFDAKDFNECVKIANIAEINKLFDVSWYVAKTLHAIALDPSHKWFNDNIHQYVIPAYQVISSKNPYYNKALEKMFAILQSQDTGKFLEEEKQEHLKNLFYIALQMKDKQTYTDQLYNQLCGYTDLQPKINNVTGDWETLIATANHTRELNKELLSLKRKLASFTSPTLFGMVENVPEVNKKFKN